jgi:hypothetical protein
MLAHLGLVVAVAISYIYDLGITTQLISRGHHPTATGVSTSAACSLASLAKVESGFTFDMATHTLLKACLIVVSSHPAFPLSARPPVRPCPTGIILHPLSDLPNSSFFVQGTLGLTVNIALLILFLAVEPNRITLTESEQHWRKQVVTVFACVVNLLLAGAGIGLGLPLSIKAADSSPLIVPLILTSIQAYVKPESLRIRKPGCLLLLVGFPKLTTCRPLAFCTAVCDAVKNYQEGQDLLD